MILQSVVTKNTHYLWKWKFHCTSYLLFYLFRFSCFGYAELTIDLFDWFNLNQSNRRIVIVSLTMLVNVLWVDTNYVELSPIRINVGREAEKAVASDTRGPRFESRHRQSFYWILCTVNCIKKTKIKKKRPGMAHFFKKRISQFGSKKISFHRCCCCLDNGLSWPILLSIYLLRKHFFIFFFFVFQRKLKC